MYLRLQVFLALTQIILVASENVKKSHLYGSETDNDIANIIFSKGYIPSNTNLLNSTLKRLNENDDTYILSKLSDDILIKLLSHQSNKKDFSIKDIIKIALDGNTYTNEERVDSTLNIEANEISTTSNKIPAYFRLEEREIKPQLQHNRADFIALKKLNNLLSNQQQMKEDKITAYDKKNELLFDILVKQLQALCCKTLTKYEESLMRKVHLKTVPTKLREKSYLKKTNTHSTTNKKYAEFMFLIINDEIKTKGSEELVLVDPETIERNSSILLLGPITTQLSNEQLLTIMNRISNELSKPEYNALLQQLSDGTFNEKNKRLVNQLMYGPKTRRYIKPHRCNHQSKLAKIYSGPKWLICTGYINVNTPSLYD